MVDRVSYGCFGSCQTLLRIENGIENRIENSLTLGRMKSASMGLLAAVPDFQQVQTQGGPCWGLRPSKEHRVWQQTFYHLCAPAEPDPTLLQLPPVQFCPPPDFLPLKMLHWWLVVSLTSDCTQRHSCGAEAHCLLALAQHWCFLPS